DAKVGVVQDIRCVCATEVISLWGRKLLTAFMNEITIVVVMVVTIHSKRVERVSATEFYPPRRGEGEGYKSFDALIESSEHIEHQVGSYQRVYSCDQRVGSDAEEGRSIRYL